MDVQLAPPGLHVAGVHRGNLGSLIVKVRVEVFVFDRRVIDARERLGRAGPSVACSPDVRSGVSGGGRGVDVLVLDARDGDRVSGGRSRSARRGSPSARDGCLSPSSGLDEGHDRVVVVVAFEVGAGGLRGSQGFGRGCGFDLVVYPRHERLERVVLVVGSCGIVRRRRRRFPFVVSHGAGLGVHGCAQELRVRP